MAAKTRLPYHHLPTRDFLSVLFLLALASVTNAATNTPTSTSSSTATASPLPTGTGTAALITPGTDCAGSEALFNCLTTSWQQCASGLWSIAIDARGEDGLACSPPGLAWDMKMVYENGTVAAGPGAGVGAGGSSELGGGSSGEDGEGAPQGTATATATATTPGSSSSSVVVGGSLQGAGASTTPLGGRWTSGAWLWLGAVLVTSAFVGF